MWQHFYSLRERSHAKVSAINQQRYLLQLSQQTLSSLTNFSLSWGTNNCLGICWNYGLMSYDGPTSVMFIGEIFFFPGNQIIRDSQVQVDFANHPHQSQRQNVKKGRPNSSIIKLEEKYVSYCHIINKLALIK